MMWNLKLSFIFNPKTHNIWVVNTSFLPSKLNCIQKYHFALKISFLYLGDWWFVPKAKYRSLKNFIINTTQFYYLVNSDAIRGHSITKWTRWGGEGVKKNLFLSTLRVYKLSTQGGQKMAKFCPRSCWDR